MSGIDPNGGGALVVPGGGGVPAPSRLATDAALPAAASALAGSCAYAEDSRRTYLCRRTGASSYGWCDVASGELAARVGPASGSGTVRGLTWAPAAVLWQSGGSLAIGWEATSVASATVRTLLHQVADASSRGWLIAASSGTVVIYYYSGGSQTATLATGLAAGAHTLAIAWVDATHLHVSVDGGAASTVTLAGAVTSADPGDSAALLQHPISVGNDGIDLRASWLRIVGSVLSDATLAVVSGTPSGYRPGDLGAAVVWGWDAVRDPRHSVDHTLWGTAAGSGATAIRAAVTTPTTLPWVVP